MSTLTLTSSATCTDGRFAYTPQISDVAYFSWLDQFCGDRFNRAVVKLFGPA